MNPRSIDCEADALTTTPSRRFSLLIAEEDVPLSRCSTAMKLGSLKKDVRRTYITAEEKRLPGHKPMKDGLTLTFCANASGNLKIKSLLVYHSKNPRAIKAHGIQKEQLPVISRANSKAWVTREIFIE